MSTPSPPPQRRAKTSLYCYKRVQVLGSAPSSSAAASSTRTDNLNAEKADENTRFYQNVRDTARAAFEANKLEFPEDDRLRIYYRDGNSTCYVSPSAPMSKERSDRDTTVYRFEEIRTDIGLLGKIKKWIGGS